jgi:hypothetical protein
LEGGEAIADCGLAASSGDFGFKISDFKERGKILEAREEYRARSSSPFNWLSLAAA